MAVSPYDEVYIAGSEQGLLIIENNSRFIRIPVSNDDIRVHSVLFDNDGNLFVISEGNLFYRAKYESSFKRLLKSHYWFRKLFVDKFNNVWATSITSGVWKYKDGKFTHYKNNDTTDFFNKTVGLSFALKDTILIGTEGGLGYIDGYTIKLYNGYGINITRPIYFIQHYDDAFWFGTDAGVYRWDKTSLRHYGTGEGISGLETNRDAIHVDNRGYLWI